MAKIKKLELGKYYLPDSCFKDFILCEGYVPFQTGDYRKKAIPAKRILAREKDIAELWSKVNADTPTQVWVADHEYSLIFDVYVFNRDGILHLGEMVRSDKVSDITQKRMQYRVWALMRMGHEIGSYTIINKANNDTIETFTNFNFISLDRYYKTLLDSFKDVLSGQRDPYISGNLCTNCFRKTHCQLVKEPSEELEDDLFLVQV